MSAGLSFQGGHFSGAENGTSALSMQPSPSDIKPVQKNDKAKKIALISRNYSIGPDGHWDYSPYFNRILQTCDGIGCETVLFSPYSLDKAAADLLSNPFGDFKNIDTIILERVLVNVTNEIIWEELEMDNLVSTVFQRGTSQPLDAHQRFASSQDSKSQKELFLSDVVSRVFGKSLLMICGETNIVSTGQAGDSYGFLSKLAELGIEIIFNPIHNYMRRYEMKEKRAILSSKNRYVASVWNTGKGREPELPWTLYYNGNNVSERIQLIDNSIPERPDILIGVFDC